jgi:hypothetical protein
MSGNQALLRWLSRALLSLYPKSFRAEFGEEMTEVFTQAIQTAARGGWRSLAGTGLRELGGLAAGACREHLAAALRRPIGGTMSISQEHKIARARWMARGLALFAGAWWSAIVLLNEDTRPEHAIGTAVLGILITAGLALGRRRERLGGLLIAGAGLALFVALNVNIFVETLFWSRIPLAALASMPFVIAGALLYACGAETAAPPAGPAQPDDRATGERSRGQPGGRPQRSEIVFAVAGVITLLLTWSGLVPFTMAMTEGLLVPWDTFGEPIRPPRGTWQRSLNDFFESGVGSFLPTATVLLASAGGLLAQLRAPGQRAMAVWVWAGANLAFFGLVLTAMLLLDPLAPLFGLEGPGYHRTWPGIVAMLVGLATLVALPRWSHRATVPRNR